MAAKPNSTVPSGYKRSGPDEDTIQDAIKNPGKYLGMTGGGAIPVTDERSIRIWAQHGNLFKKDSGGGGSHHEGGGEAFHGGGGYSGAEAQGFGFAPQQQQPTGMFGGSPMGDFALMLGALGALGGGSIFGGGGQQQTGSAGPVIGPNGEIMFFNGGTGRYEVIGTSTPPLGQQGDVPIGVGGDIVQTPTGIAQAQNGVPLPNTDTGGVGATGGVIAGNGASAYTPYTGGQQIGFGSVSPEISVSQAPYYGGSSGLSYGGGGSSALFGGGGSQK